MLFLANKGVDILRFDAPGLHVETDGHALPVGARGAHDFARAARRLPDRAPAVIHLEEAIVGPAEMIPYLGRGEHDGKEGNLAYHNSLMVQFWSALAARDTVADVPRDAHPFPAERADQRHLCHLPALPRRHRLGGDRRGCGRGRRVGLRLTGRSCRISTTAPFPAASPAGRCSRSIEATGDKRISGPARRSRGWNGRSKPATPGRSTAIDRILMGHALIASLGRHPADLHGRRDRAVERLRLRDGPPNTRMTAAGCIAR
jgi:amylosucrase